MAVERKCAKRGRPHLFYCRLEPVAVIERVRKFGLPLWEHREQWVSPYTIADPTLIALKKGRSALAGIM